MGKEKRVCHRPLTLLQEYDAGEPVVEVPEVDAADAALVVELAVDVEGLVGADLHAADLLGGGAGSGSGGSFVGARTTVGTGTAAATTTAGVVEGRVELVAPGGPVAVAVAVVVAEQVLATGLAAPAHGQGLVYRRQQVLRQLRRDVDQAVQVRRRVLRVQAAEQVAGLFKISGLAGVGFIGRGRG